MNDILTAQEELVAILSIPYFYSHQQSHTRMLETWKRRTPDYQNLVASLDNKTVEHCHGTCALWLAQEVSNFPSSLSFGNVGPLIVSLGKTLIEERSPDERFKLLSWVVNLLNVSPLTAKHKGSGSALQATIGKIFSPGLSGLNSQNPAHVQKAVEFLSVVHATFGSSPFEHPWRDKYLIPFVGAWMQTLQSNSTPAAKKLLSAIEVEFVTMCIREYQKEPILQTLDQLNAILPHLHTPSTDPRWANIAKIWKSSSPKYVPQWNVLHDALEKGLSSWPSHDVAKMKVPQKKVLQLFDPNQGLEVMLPTISFSGSMAPFIPLVVKQWQQRMFYTLSKPTIKSCRQATVALDQMEKNPSFFNLFHATPLSEISWNEWSASGTLTSFNPKRKMAIPKSKEMKDIMALLNRLPDSIKDTLLLVYPQHTNGQWPEPTHIVPQIALGRATLMPKMQEEFQQWNALFQSHNLRTTLTAELVDDNKATRARKM